MKPIEIDARTQNAVLSAPRAAIIESWLRLELAIGGVLETIGGISERPSSPDRMLHTLFSQQLVDGPFYEVLVELRELREQAAKDDHAEFTSENARRYAEAVEQCINLLHTLATRKIDVPEDPSV